MWGSSLRPEHLARDHAPTEYPKLYVCCGFWVADCNDYRNEYPLATRDHYLGAGDDVTPV